MLLQTYQPYVKDPVNDPVYQQNPVYDLVAEKNSAPDFEYRDPVLDYEYADDYELPEKVLFSRSTARPKLTLDFDSGTPQRIVIPFNLMFFK